MAISMKDLQSVHLKKTESLGLGKKSESKAPDPIKKLLKNSSKGFGSDTKGDLIAELKLSHTIGGISKLRSEQQKAAEEVEKEQYRKFLGQFTTENFLKKIPSIDPLGNEIPKWKREMLAKKAAEKAKQEALEERARLEEERRMSAIPAWKRQLIAQKGEDSKRINNIPTLTRVNEEVNPHDIEYPDIPSIPEEQEEEQDQPSPVSNSPVNFPEFSPETELVKPWKGILKKSSSVNVNSSMY